jgi:hypothetical protein
LIDHLCACTFNGGLPLLWLKSIIYFWSAVRKDNAAGGVYESTEAVLIEATGDPGGCSTLMAEARDEDPGVGHGVSECRELLGPCCADNGTDCTVLLVAGCLDCCGLYTFGDMIVDMALVNLEVLKIFPTWV